MDTAEELLQQGNIDEALTTLQAQIRKDPSNSKLRIFLFQLLVLMGDLDRAMNQLNVLSDMDDATLAMVHMYREALKCEALRKEVFAGTHTPVIFGKPDQWMALVLDALRLDADGEHTKAQLLREQAYEQAEEVSGNVNGEACEWIADADSRIGPFVEAIINGNYYWVPFQRVKKIQIDEPEDLRDLVWTPAFFTWANGGETIGLIPVRYPDSHKSEDSAIVMAKKTEWDEKIENVYFGYGQRLFTTDANDYSLLDTRVIELDVADESSEEKQEVEELVE